MKKQQNYWQQECCLWQWWPNVALAAENTTANTESNSDININLQRKSVVLGSKSNASVKFKEN